MTFEWWQVLIGSFCGYAAWDGIKSLARWRRYRKLRRDFDRIRSTGSTIILPNDDRGDR